VRVGHFIHQLNPFGTERMLEALLKFRSVEFGEQFVVSYTDGPMRRVFEGLGVRVWVTRDQREISRRFKEADLVNLHLLHPETIPQCLARGFPRRKVITVQWMSPFPPGLADRFIATSLRTYELQPDVTRCDLIPNGIDLERFHGKRAASGRRVICRICRPQKCDEFFWYGLLPVLVDYPDVQLWLAGTEEQSTDRVRVLGVVTDVVDILASSYLFAYTPRPWEGSHDFVVMEAMSMGVPCVLSDVPTIRQSVSNDCAVLVPFNDANRFAASVRHLLEDVEAAAELGQRARDYALAHFDVRPRVAEYESAYRRAVRCA
jgi:glycosyltransferase involved in cell wall biosynthesis